MQFQGIYAPLATPFDHEGAIYWRKFDANMAQLQQTALSGFMVTDNWGEGASLSATEKVAIWRRATSLLQKQHAVLAFIGGHGVSETIDLVTEAAKAGCAAAVIRAPELDALAPQQIGKDKLFFLTVADSAKLPLFAEVNLDSHTGRNTELIISLSKHPKLCGAVLNAAEDLDMYRVTESVRNTTPRFSILIRNFLLVPSHLQDGIGAILPLASVVPFFCLSIEEAIRTRESDAADALVERASELNDLFTNEGVPALKHALDLRGYYGGNPRLPLLRASSLTGTEVGSALDEIAN